ncbi:integrase [Streptomyces sp. NBC_00151]|uniref:integrase n=1 Tax=Streptomyces sp. NBC_00151 TaxID=2975669 RepID=UPI002DDBAF8D|nr:integrase [Streptomyces sp. NBC_00151]
MNQHPRAPTSVTTCGSSSCSNHRNHTAQTRALHAYLRWRNKNARHPDVLAAQRKERARIRSEKGIRWGGRSFAA